MYSAPELYCHFNYSAETGSGDLFYHINFDSFICKKISVVKKGGNLDKFIKEYLGLNLVWYINKNNKNLYNKLIT